MTSEYLAGFVSIYRIAFPLTQQGQHS